MTELYTFLPWVRQGAVSTITTEDSLNGDLDSRAWIDVKVFLNGNTNQDNPPDATVTARLYGPGDVTGFDARQVIRTDPLHLTSDFEPNYFPVVEFDRPDFPWLFTPARAKVTPATNSKPAEDNGRLRPWICLVAVEKRDDKIKIDPGKPLPILNIEDAQQELPDLSESWAWAHAQVSGELTTDQPLGKVLADKPERTLSRLLCPRRLEPNKSYYACVVPTFDIGRKAGLGEEIKDGKNEDGTPQDDATLKPAWNANTTVIKLPVYYHWEFSTGAAGDFESLVWLLQRRPLSAEVGARKIKVTKPDVNWPEPDAFEVPLEGALRPPGAQNSIATPQPFQDDLQKLLNAGEIQQTPATLPPGLPIPPPIYGRWHAAQKAIPDGKRDVVWLRDLNLNPSHRAVAGIGTQIVQDQQEQLMASAWEQVGEIEKANQAMRQAQLARAAGTMIHEQHLEAIPAEPLFVVTGATHTRVLAESANALDPQPDVPSTKTVSAFTEASRVPKAMVQGPFRRLTRPRGPFSRRVKGGLRAGELIKELNAGNISVVPQKITPDSMVTMDEVFQETGRKDVRFCAEYVQSLLDAVLEPIQTAFFSEQNGVTLDDILKQLGQLLAKKNLPEEIPGLFERVQSNLTLCRSLLDQRDFANFPSILQELTAAGDLLRDARRILFEFGSEHTNAVDEIRGKLRSIVPSQDFQQRLLFGFAAREHLRDMESCEPVTLDLKPKLQLEEIQKTLLKGLNPEITVPKRIMARLTLPPAWKKRLEDPVEPVDELELIMIAPELPAPMYKPLADLSQDLILPGLEHVPPNTIALLETNARFIEAYMVGLNHEMSRELLWREFPTDQRGTYFRQFWDSRGRVSQPQNLEDLKDIEPIPDWSPANGLGKNLTGDATKSQTVLLIRGDLLRRYPRAIIYAAEAKWVQAKDDDDKLIFDNQGNPVMIREPKELPENPDPNKSGFPEKYPIFQGTLAPDITFLGFNLDPMIAKGIQNEPGWFFVLQQPPTEPRYGLDETETPPKDRTGTWRDMSWENLTLTNNNHIKLSNAFIGNFTAPTTPANVKWASNSAAMAYITLQGPFRVAIHASDLLPVEESKP